MLLRKILMEAKALSFISIKTPNAKAMQKGTKCGTREWTAAAAGPVATFGDNVSHKYWRRIVIVHTIMFLCINFTGKWKKNFHDLSCSREIPDLRQKLLAENPWFSTEKIKTDCFFWPYWFLLILKCVPVSKLFLEHIQECYYIISVSTIHQCSV